MNCENICVCSSWEYSLWLERSRDLRKPGGSGWVTRGLPQFSICHSPLPPSSLYPALSSRRSGSMALEVTLLPQTFSNTTVISQQTCTRLLLTTRITVSTLRQGLPDSRTPLFPPRPEEGKNTQYLCSQSVSLLLPHGAQLLTMPSLKPLYKDRVSYLP